ncbi:MAG: hypothetical protein Q7T53_09690 [Deltaproteobacteria bacterium]|nr:hypothetical protein [Deltaproteobacteria bacterium]
MIKTVSQSEFARQMGVTPGYINKLIKTGVLKLQDGKIDPLKGKKALQGAIDHGGHGGKRVKQPVSLTLLEARTAKETALATLRDLEAKEKQGELINKDELLFSLKDLFLTVRSRLMQLPVKVAGQICHLAKHEDRAESKVIALLTGEINELLREFSNYIGPQIGPKTGGDKDK